MPGTETGDQRCSLEEEQYKFKYDVHHKVLPHLLIVSAFKDSSAYLGIVECAQDNLGKVGAQSSPSAMI